MKRPVSLTVLRASTQEVAALLVIPLVAAGALFRREISVVPARRHTHAQSGVLEISEALVTTPDLVAAPDDYYARAHASVCAIVLKKDATVWQIE